MRTRMHFLFCAACLAAGNSFAATFTVTLTNESGPGSLRQAFLDANATPGPDFIYFNIGTVAKSILPTNALPAITEPVTVDGTTQPGFSNAPIVELNGQSAGTGTDGLRVWAGGTTIRGLVINRFSGDGIEIATNGNNVVEGCWIGLGTDGTTRRANANGIFITNSPNNTIGGVSASQRNLITGNNQNGVRVEGPASFGTLVLGNWIGLNVNSSAGVGNSQSGVYFLNAPSNTVGGTEAGARNLLGGNAQNGVRLEGSNAQANAVLGNFIGLDLTGATNRNNGNNGVYLLNAPSNTIGGATAGARNIIAGNSQAGVRIEGVTTRGNRVLGNLVGTDVSGTLARGNGGEGVYVLGNAFANTIGGTNSGEANGIAHNGADGIYVQNGTNNLARANAIHSNGGLGIDLGNNGVQANDTGDPDTGANNLQNFPILYAATNTASGLFVAGLLNSRPGAGFSIDFYSSTQCDPSTNGEGQVWLGSLGVTTGADSNAPFALTLPVGASGRFITATATDTQGNTSEFSPCVRAESTMAPLTFAVTNTNDSGPGSLRQAITDNNLAVRSNRNSIVLAIPGVGPHTIAPASPLPTLTEAVAVDGFTQAGSAPNSLPAGNNAVWQIVLDGAAIATAGTDGLRVEGNGCLIQGLAITRFADNGIELATNASCTVRGCLIGLGLDGSDQGNANSGIYLINSAGNLIGGTSPAARNVISGQNSFHGIGLSGAGASNNVIQGNFIGTGLDGTGDLGNAQDGLNLNGAPGNLIGGGAPGAGNVISGNNGDGIEINGASATGNQVLGNLIGFDATGAGALGNTQHGLQLTSSARGNVIGGALAGEGNRIAHNLNGDGITVASGTNNTLRGNAIFSNGGLGIDLANNGLTPNDAGDADTGANQLQNFPLVTGATMHVGSTFITGTLNSRSNATYTLDFFSSLVCDPSTNGEGQVYLGSSTATTGPDSNAAFSVTLPVTAVGRFITATATDPFGNTSEFGPCLRATSFLPPQTFTVSNTNDAGPGSLRQALLDNNVTYFGSPNTIAFAIPGMGPHAIAPASALPDITEPVLIDGFTQPNATPNTLPDGNNAVLQIRLAGRPFTDGLRLRADGCTVRGLIIVNWGSDGIEIAGCDDCIVTGCFLGVNSDGTAAFNSSSGVSVSYGGGHRIGGTAPADRNAIIGVFLTLGSSNNVVQGNLIGCGLRGTNTVGFPGYGIIIEDSTDNLIGGAAPGARNVISGNSGHAIHLRGATPARNVIAGNFIGPDVTGLKRLGNGRGVSIEAGSSNRLGGATAAERNVISGNSSDGVAVLFPAGGNEILGNWIGVDATGSGALSNSAVGIYLTGHSNRVGGVAAGEANVIAHSTGPGVVITGLGNSIRGNSIHDSFTAFPFNPALGIDLGYNGVTPNDTGDGDSGGNNFQNFPILLAATGTVSTVHIIGTLHSAVNTSFAVDFFSNPTCDPSGYGEGQMYLGSATVVTDGSGNASFNATLPRPLAGRYVTATATDPAGNTSEFAPCLAEVSTVPGATLVVTTTNDSGPGSLRQAIRDANQLVTAGNTIAFNIPGSGMRVIRPLTPLPAFIEPVMMDGFTQPGAGANSLPAGNNANWLIELNGSALTGGQHDGLRLNVPGTVVRGLRITGFNHDGLEVSAANCVIAGNHIVSNGSAGVHLLAATAVVGGVAPADRNVIAANASYGVYLDETNATGNQVLGNLIGTDASGVAAGGSQFWGVTFWNASDNNVGGVAAGAANVIAFHDSAGVFVQSGTNNAVRANRIFDNGDPGLDLGFSGVTANDLDDADSGANQLQNFPVITNATAAVGSTQIRGALQSGAGVTFALDFFSGVDCHWSGHGQGQFYLGSAGVTTDANGHGSFEVTLPVTMIGNVLTATATDPAGNTSEFSPCFSPAINLPGQTYVVTTTADSGPGSLRQALLDSAYTANSTPDQILFNIPGGGVKLIALLTPLPEPEDAVFVDGFSQPGASANTSTNADNAVLRVQLDGSAIGFAAFGLGFTNHGNRVRGLSFTGFGAAGMALNSASNVVEGCWFGLAPSGLPGGNTGSGLAVYGPANLVGGTAPAARNIIAGHEDYGLVIAGSLAIGNVVQGNFIGVGPSGSSAPGNGRDGIILAQARGNLIGGTNAGAGNLIGGNGRHGIRLESGASGNRVEANFIGASFDFTTGLTNHDGGVLIVGSSSNTIGGWAEEAANVIAYNDGPGVWVWTGTQNGIIGNDIGSNTGKDIQVSPGANDNVQPPKLDWAVLGSTRVKGEFGGQPNTTYRISVMAERLVKGKVRKRRLESFTITTDALGYAAFDQTLSKSFPRRNTGRVFANATCLNSSSENSGGVPLLGQGEVNLVLDARLAFDPVPRGQDAVVLISVTNRSPTNADSVVVHCTRPPGCNVAGATNPHGPTTVVGDQVRCDVGSVLAGAGKTLTISFQPTLPGGGLHQVYSELLSRAQPEGFGEDNTALTPFYLLPPLTNADLAITVTLDAAPIIHGEVHSVMVTARNFGPSDAQGVNVGLPLPQFTEYFNHSQDRGTVSFQAAVQVVNWQIPALAVGEAAMLTLGLRTRMDPARSETHLLTATGFAQSPPDPNLPNNMDFKPLEVRPPLLDVRYVNGQVIVSYGGSAAPFELQAADTLSSGPVDFHPVPSSLIATSGQDRVFITDPATNPAGANFFTLILPPLTNDLPRVDLSQLHLNLDNVAYPFSEWGAADLTFKGAPDLSYFNLNVDNTWVVQNMPVTSYNPTGSWQTLRFNIPLTASYGQAKQFADVAYGLTTNMLPVSTNPAPPTLGLAVTNAPVAPYPTRQATGGQGEPLNYRAPVPLVGGPVVSNATGRPVFPNRPQGTNECAPAAVLNSLEYLNRLYSLNLSTQLLSMATIKEAIGWDSSGAPVGFLWWNSWVDNKVEYMEEHNIPIETVETTDPRVAMEALRMNHDLELRIHGHVACVREIKEHGNGMFTLTLSHDTVQGVDGVGEITEQVTFDADAGYISGDAGWGAYFDKFVIERPKP